MTALKEKVIRGLAWSSANVFVKHGLGFMIHIVLARLLVPEDFGVIGMISIFMQLSLRLQGAGLGEALIRQGEVNRESYNFVFFYGVVVGSCLYGIFYFSAPLIASFYGEPKLIWVTRLITLNLIIIPLSGINRIQLVKELEFNKIAITEITASVLSGGIAILLAYHNFGYLSLVIQNICLYFFSMLLLVVFNRWLPSFSFNRADSVKLFSFGSQLMVANFIQVGFNNIYNVIIGKQYSAAHLGLYMQGMKLQGVPSNAIGTVIKNVSFPAFAKIRDDKARYNAAFRETVRLLTFINFPLLTVLAVTADTFIPLLLSEKWAGSVPFFQMLIIIGLLEPVKSLFVTQFKVSGRADLLIKTIIFTKLFFVIGILITLRINLYAIVISQVVATCIELFFFAGIGREIGYSVTDFIYDILPNAATALLTGAAILLFSPLTGLEGLPALITEIAAGASLFLAIAALTRNPGLVKLKAEISSRLG